ncbi:MAG: N-acetyl-gamma-glutamyl-phosphate reductase [Acidobacteriaceae bacterium]
MKTNSQSEYQSEDKTGYQTAVIGVSGYAGAELARLLLNHPRLRGHAPIFFGRSEEDADGKAKSVRLTDLHPQLAGNSGADGLMIVPFHWDALQQHGVDVIFLATPHEQSRAWVPQLLDRGVRVIDLSGAWRLMQDRNRAVYKLTDADPEAAQIIQQNAVYGMPELHRDKIAAAKLVANPGCYSTCSILALAPLVRENWIDLNRGIICDAKSGVSGAGKAPTAKTHFMNASDNLSAYSVFGHRHTGELLEQLGLQSDEVIFTPHLLPIPRGILSTNYVRLKTPTTPEAIDACYRNFYADSPMVRWFGTRLPEIQHSVRTSYCDIGFALAPDGQRLILVSCLDNLLKGASGQAVQNMNLLFGWPEQEGLA